MNGRERYLEAVMILVYVVSVMPVESKATIQ
jgi:hypothetical protein